MTTNAPPTSAIIADACFSDLKNYIVAATGMEYYTTRPHALAEHVRSRILENGLNECREYWDFLRDDRFSDEELDRLTERLTIGETHFFRHREVFDALRDKVLPEMLDRNRATQRLRVWSAGCSTGPEAYSISILLRRELVARTRDWNISIVGTDINRLALSQAGAGRYEEWAFRGTPPELRTECFEQDGNAWRIADRFRDGVTFQYHNLARHPVPSLTHNLAAFDLIFCRNVLIYFAAEAVERIVSQLAECLVPGGWLVIGHAEHGAKCLSALEAVTSQGTTLYRKPAVAFADAASLIGDERTVSDTCQRVCRNSAELQEGGRVFASPRFVEEKPRVARQSIASRAGDRSAVRRSPTSLQMNHLRSLADQGNVDVALRLCDSMIALSPLQANLHFYKALLVDQVFGHESALVALHRAIYLDPDFVLAHYYLGMTLLKLCNAAGATRSFRNVRRLTAGRNPSEKLPDAEGMTVGDLDELTRLHIELLEAA